MFHRIYPFLKKVNHHLFNTHGIEAGCAKWWQIEDLLVRVPDQAGRALVREGRPRQPHRRAGVSRRGWAVRLTTSYMKNVGYAPSPETRESARKRDSAAGLPST